MLGTGTNGPYEPGQMIPFLLVLAHDGARYISYAVSMGVLHFCDQMHKAPLFLICFQTS